MILDKDPPKLFTRERATYVCPHSKILLPTSISAISSDAPCDL